MHVLIAPDKFKSSLSADAAADAISRGLSRSLPSATLTSSPIADGGEGTTDILHSALGGSWHYVATTDPLNRPIRPRYALADLSGTPTAIMEMGAASGLHLVLDLPPDPWSASTFGTGTMIRHAIRSGAKHILIGIGGSATNDGGSGMARALGFRFLDPSGTDLHDIPADLPKAASIIPPPNSNLPIPTVSVACDVTNPLLGPHGATAIYGPQKGVPASDLSRHEARLAHLADLVSRHLGHDPRHSPGAGAAGGLGFGLLAFCNATLHPGFHLVADALHLRQKIAAADLVITGEGHIDASSLSGKAPAGLAHLARLAGKPVVALCGRADLDHLGGIFDLVLPIRPPDMPLAEALARAAELLEEKVAESAPLLQRLACPKANPISEIETPKSK